MRLVHFSAAPIEIIHDTPQPPERYGWKPKGLWVSDEDDDKSWSDYASGVGFLNTDHVYSVELDMSKILHVKTEKEFEAFEEKYLSPLPGLPEDLFNDGLTIIRWSEIAEEYDGILITPFQFPRLRNGKSSWYLPWDCASGCIWRVRAVTKFIEITAG